MNSKSKQNVSPAAHSSSLRLPQSPQSVPHAQSAVAAPIDPSSQTPSWAQGHAFVQPESAVVGAYVGCVVIADSSQMQPPQWQSKSSSRTWHV